MVAILESPEVRQMVSPSSVDDYHQMGEFTASGRRTELIRSLVIEKMRKSPLHAFLLRYLFLLTTTLLAIEVTVASVALDREKASLYAEADVQEHWIVLANDEAIEVHIAPSTGRYTQQRIYRRGETLLSAALPNLQVELDALFAS